MKKQKPILTSLEDIKEYRKQKIKEGCYTCNYFIAKMCDGIQIDCRLELAIERMEKEKTNG